MHSRCKQMLMVVWPAVWWKPCHTVLHKTISTHGRRIQELGIPDEYAVRKCMLSWNCNSTFEVLSIQVQKCHLRNLTLRWLLLGQHHLTVFPLGVHIGAHCTAPVMEVVHRSSCYMMQVNEHVQSLVFYISGMTWTGEPWIPSHELGHLSAQLASIATSSPISGWQMHFGAAERN